MPGEIWVTGPVIELVLHHADPRPPSVTLKGMIDTGASVVCIDKRIALELGLVAVNRKLMEVADGTQVEATAFMVRMSIAGLGFDDWVEVFALPTKTPTSRVLLGRSFLKRYLVTYNGPEELFHFYDAPRFGRLDEWDG